MKSLALSTKLFALVMLPIIGLMFFGARIAWEKWTAYHDYAALGKNSVVLKEIGEAVHELQKESGRSTGYLGSKGRIFGGELRDQRKASDAALARLDAIMVEIEAEGLEPEFVAKFKIGRDGLRELAGKRQAIDGQQMSYAAAVEYYTQAIEALLHVVVEMSHLSKDTHIAEGISCYANFLEAKEHADIERAILTGVFASGVFSADMQRHLDHVAGKEEAYYRVFEAFAREEQRQFAAAKLTGKEVEKVAQLRSVAFEKAATGDFGVSATAWFDAATARIELMMEVEERLKEDYTRQAGEIQGAAWHHFVVAIATVAVLSLFTLGATAQQLRSISKQLRRVADQLLMGSNELTQAANQVSAASQQAAAGVSEQAASLQETSASLEQMTGVTKRNATAANEAKSISDQTRGAADAGSSEMTAMISAMDALNASSSNIAKIVKSIDEIAFQTNILALNAAVEAARAGEAGAGFAVVAEEVRALAQRSAQAARETADKIDESVRNSHSGVRISKRIAEHFQEITVKAHRVDSLVGEIAASSQEQMQGIQQVNNAVAQIDKVTQSSAAGSEETAAQAEEMNAQALELRRAVGVLMQLVNGRRKNDLNGLPGEPMVGGRRAGDPAPVATKPAPALRAAPAGRTARAPQPEEAFV